MENIKFEFTTEGCDAATTYLVSNGIISLDESKNYDGYSLVHSANYWWLKLNPTLPKQLTLNEIHGLPNDEDDDTETPA